MLETTMKARFQVRRQLSLAHSHNLLSPSVLQPIICPLGEEDIMLKDFLATILVLWDLILNRLSKLQSKHQTQ